MAIKIGNASIDENGKIAGGKEGDQTTKEICIRDWYDKKWNVYLECIDKELADKAAEFMEQICKNNKHGYDQNQRWTGYHSIRDNGNKVKGTKGEWDCSSSTIGSYLLAGLEIKSKLLKLNPEKYTIYTGNLKDLLLSTGKFKAFTDPVHLTSDKYAKRGGIYLSEGHHVVMAFENGTSKRVNPYTIPTSTVEFGDTGTSVRWVQFELIEAGYTKVKITGDFDTLTDKYVKEYQKSRGLEVDGKVGPITRKSFI